MQVADVYDIGRTIHEGFNMKKLDTYGLTNDAHVKGHFSNYICYTSPIDQVGHVIT